MNRVDTGARTLGFGLHAEFFDDRPVPVSPESRMAAGSAADENRKRLPLGCYIESTKASNGAGYSATTKQQPT
ncbi:hypothetical protein, partial [Pseudomonas aeruginosa]|uniref:hypothetical protein n=1 Tax=Pseudomonas aeruginosa TaxID=287 RepID=UPI0019693DC0